jgi:hypothetical protein
MSVKLKGLKDVSDQNALPKAMLFTSAVSVIFTGAMKWKKIKRAKK